MSENSLKSSKTTFSKISVVKKYYPKPERTLRNYMVEIVTLVRGANFVKEHYINWVENQLLSLKMQNETTEIIDLYEMNHTRLQEEYRGIIQSA